MHAKEPDIFICSLVGWDQTRDNSEFETKQTIRDTKRQQRHTKQLQRGTKYHNNSNIFCSHLVSLTVLRVLLLCRIVGAFYIYEQAYCHIIHAWSRLDSNVGIIVKRELE